MTTILTLILLFTLNSNPPGTVKVNNYYVDSTEIQNIHWLEYLHYKSKELDSLERKTLLPDSVNFWFRRPNHRFEPIVFITYEQAVDYCKWRSEVVSKLKGRKTTYRLPTPEEWSEIAEEILSTDSTKLNKELLKLRKNLARKKNKPKYIVAERKEFDKDNVHDLFSSVSEMTLEKNVAMGSNNNELTGLNQNISRIIKYDAPNLYLGFRCIAVVE